MLAEFLDRSLPWLEVARALGIRFFAHAHGQDVSERLREPSWRRDYLRYNDADGIVTMSQDSRDRLIELGISASLVHVIPYGVHVPSAAPVRRPERKTVGCIAVGRLVAKKAPILTLDAFRRAVGQNPALRLDIVGAGPLLPAVRHFIRAFDLESRVTLHGSQGNDYILELMRNADLFIQHSVTASTGDAEGLPVAILEAMASGLPVVSTVHAGIPEAVVNCVTGYLVSEGDSVGMSEHIASLAADADARFAMGRAGWSRASERFTWEQERDHLRQVMKL